MGRQRLENARNVIVQSQRERKQANAWRSDEHQEIIVLAFANVCLRENPHHVKLFNHQWYSPRLVG